MKKINYILAAVALLFGVSTAQAQSVEDNYPYNFITIQGGAQGTFTNYDFTKLITPQAAVSFGRYFNSKVGARAHFQGWQKKGAINDTYKFNAVTGDLDLLMNMSNIIPSKTMVPDEAALFTKCYSNMALQGQGGQGGDCDIDGLDGGTAGFVRQLFNSNELTTDEAICAWGDPGIPAFNYNQYDASHPMLKGFYYRLYTGIAFCNHYLEVCAGMDATREAEVRFLRALYYYHLMDAFGNVPFATALMSTPPPQIQRADLFKWIEEELLDLGCDLLCFHTVVAEKAQTVVRS